ncbi:MAG: baseplate multidomain protein megatron, partial [Pikeienuella sp.]
MATLMLSAAGASAGASIGMPVLGRAAGALAGGMIDQQVLGRGAQAVETGRVDGLRIQGASEGAVIPRLFGRMRLAGELIWSSRFSENVDSSRRGAKGGGQKVNEFRYTISLAVSLCEGVVDRIGRVWVDGVETALDDVEFRLHHGGEDQQPDPLIEQIEGGAPAFRGLAYVVFEDLPLGRFGNRIPQFNFEVFRTPDSSEQGPVGLGAMTRAVALSPGSGEFALETLPVRRLEGPGQEPLENVNSNNGTPDLIASLDVLEIDAPACEAVSLIVSWFGNDLRASECQIQPAVERHDKETKPVEWRVGGMSRGSVNVVSTDDEGRPNYGGTPSDGSVIAAIRELNSRGKNVMFYPFILMDIPEGNGRSDPYTGAENQPAFPWRGRITTSVAAGVSGSSDKTSVAIDEVGAFFGDAKASDFHVSGETVSYSGPNEWSFSRFILHYAHLCAVAGGVDAFCVGSELRGLTQIRSGAVDYPFVDRMIDLAAEVRSILGAGTKLGYAADWSEYFGHQPGDGDVVFHLDPLWSDVNIDFVGIDNYLPLADWRHSETHADVAAGAVYDADYLGGNVEGGEGYDWYYASHDHRKSQTRTPIVDTAHGEDWVFRPKDIRGWWSNSHHNRIGGVRTLSATAWVPESKP